MTDAEKIARVKVLVDNDAEATDNLIQIYLDDAKATIMHRVYPFRIPTVTDDNGTETEVSMPGRYDILQCKLASRYFLRRGAEGEKTHNENGINRTYGSINDEDLLMEVVQVIC